MQVASWVEKIDEKFGHWAIPHVTRYVVILHLVTYVLNIVSPGFADTLLLDGRTLRFGEVWRVMTFMCVPPSNVGIWFFPANMGPLWMFLYLWVTWFVGDALEEEWGPGKVNIYYLTGIIALTVVALFFTPGSVRSDLLISSLILPFGTLFPTMEFLLFFIIPVAARYLAMFFGGMMVLALLLGFLDRFVVFASILPYLLFFGPTFLADWRQQQEVNARRRRFEGK